MLLTIDNLDGLGAVDYSAAVDDSAPLAVTRVLNAPSILKGILCLEGGKLPTPVRRGRVVVTSDSGTVLFTGYLTTEPVAVYAGVASEGAVYRFALHAVSDEWLLDKGAAGLRSGKRSRAKQLERCSPRLRKARARGCLCLRRLQITIPWAYLCLEELQPGAVWQARPLRQVLGATVC